MNPPAARMILRSPTRDSRHVFDCPPGPEPTPPVIFPNITQLGNRPLFCHATAPAKKSWRIRMVVSMLSHSVFLRDVAYERVVWPVSCRGWKLMTRKRTWCTVRAW